MDKVFQAATAATYAAVIFLTVAMSVGAAALVQQSPIEPSTHDLWLAVLAIITVGVTSLINMLPPRFSDLAKRVIAGGVAAVLATVGVYYQGILDTNDWGRTWLVIFMAATTLYVVLVKPLGAFVKQQQAA